MRDSPASKPRKRRRPVGSSDDDHVPAVSPITHNDHDSPRTPVRRLAAWQLQDSTIILDSDSDSDIEILSPPTQRNRKKQKSTASQQGEMRPSSFSTNCSTTSAFQSTIASTSQSSKSASSPANISPVASVSSSSGAQPSVPVGEDWPLTLSHIEPEDLFDEGQNQLLDLSDIGIEHFHVNEHGQLFASSSVARLTVPAAEKRVQLSNLAFEDLDGDKQFALFVAAEHARVEQEKEKAQLDEDEEPVHSDPLPSGQDDDCPRDQSSSPLDNQPQSLYSSPSSKGKETPFEPSDFSHTVFRDEIALYRCATGQEVATSLLVTVKSNASDLYQSLENDLQTAVVQSTKAQRTQARADGLQLMERLIAIVKQATGGRTLLSYDDFVGPSGAKEDRVHGYLFWPRDNCKSGEILDADGPYTTANIVRKGLTRFVSYFRDTYVRRRPWKSRSTNPSNPDFHEEPGVGTRVRDESFATAKSIFIESLNDRSIGLRSITVFGSTNHRLATAWLRDAVRDSDGGLSTRQIQVPVIAPAHPSLNISASNPVLEAYLVVEASRCVAIVWFAPHPSSGRAANINGDANLKTLQDGARVDAILNFMHLFATGREVADDKNALFARDHSPSHEYRFVATTHRPNTGYKQIIDLYAAERQSGVLLTVGELSYSTRSYLVNNGYLDARLPGETAGFLKGCLSAIGGAGMRARKRKWLDDHNGTEEGWNVHLSEGASHMRSIHRAKRAKENEDAEEQSQVYLSNLGRHRRNALKGEGSKEHKGTEDELKVGHNRHKAVVNNLQSKFDLSAEEAKYAAYLGCLGTAEQGKGGKTRLANDRNKIRASDPNLDAPTVFFSNLGNLFGDLATTVFSGVAAVNRIAILNRLLRHLIPGARRRNLLPSTFDENQRQMYKHMRHKFDVELVPVKRADLDPIDFIRFQRRVTMARPLIRDLGSTDKNLLRELHVDALAWIGCAILSNWLILGPRNASEVPARGDDEDVMTMEQEAAGPNGRLGRAFTQKSGGKAKQAHLAPIVRAKMARK